MGQDSDDDYDRVSDYELSASESEDGYIPHSSPSTTPPLSTSQQSAVKTIPCPYENCYKVFNRQIRLKEHLRSHTNTRPYTCPHPHCTKTFIRDTHLNQHVKSAHSNIRDYKCTWNGCEAAFATGTRLRRHIETHEGKERFRCRGYEACNETFRKHDTLRRHVMSVHENMKPFPCPEVDARSGKRCDKAFETAEKVRQHQRTRHNPTRFSCELCLTKMREIAAGMAGNLSPDDTPSIFFPTYSELQEHQTRVHPPTCPHCPTSFITNRELTRHLEIQHGICNATTKTTKHPCTYPDCSKVFSKKGNLNVHIRTFHENKRDFVCGKTTIPLPEEVDSDVEVHGCGRDFTSKASLEEHVRTAHLGLESQRAVQNRKRKAEKAASTASTDHDVPKTRKARKDKGTKKTSVISELMSTHAQTEYSMPDFVDPTKIELHPHPHQLESQQANIQAHKTLSADEDEEVPEYAHLTGSITLYGNKIYHSTGQWHYAAGEYKPGLQPLSGPIENSYFAARNGGDEHEVEQDGFFGDMDHDHEQEVRMLFGGGI